MRRTFSLLLVIPVVLALLAAPLRGAEPPPRRTALVTVEGVVREIGQRSAEGGLETVVARLEVQNETSGPVLLVLAPQETLQEIGFPLAEGDLIRARAFVADDGYSLAYKVLNISQDSMVRFRSLRQVPLWDNQARWQGGECRPHPQGMGQRQRGGGGRR